MASRKSRVRALSCDHAGISVPREAAVRIVVLVRALMKMQEREIILIICEAFVQHLL